MRKGRRFVLYPNQSALHQLQEYCPGDCPSESVFEHVGLDHQRIRVTINQVLWKTPLFLLGCFIEDVAFTLTLLFFFFDRCGLLDFSTFCQRKDSTIRYLVTVLWLLFGGVNPLVRLVWYRLVCIWYISLVVFILRSILVSKVAIITCQYRHFLEHAHFESQFCYHRSHFSDNDDFTKHLIESKIKLNQHLHQIIHLMSSHQQLRPLLSPLSSLGPCFSDTNAFSRSLPECQRCFHLLFSGSKPLISLISPRYYIRFLYTDARTLIHSAEGHHSSLFHLIEVCVKCLEYLVLPVLFLLLLYREIGSIQIILSDFLHGAKITDDRELTELHLEDKIRLKPLTSLKTYGLKCRNVFERLRGEVLKSELFIHKYDRLLYDFLRHQRDSNEIDLNELGEAIQYQLEELSSLCASTVPLFNITLEQMVCSLKELHNALSRTESECSLQNADLSIEHRAGDANPSSVEESHKVVYCSPLPPSGIISHEIEQEEGETADDLSTLRQQETYLQVYSAITEPENFDHRKSRALKTEETRQRLLDHHLLLELRQRVRSRLEKSAISINWRNYRDMNDFDEQVIVNSTFNLANSTSQDWSPQLLEIFPALKEAENGLENGFHPSPVPPASVDLPFASPTQSLTHLHSEIFSNLHRFNSALKDQTIYGEDSEEDA